MLQASEPVSKAPQAPFETSPVLIIKFIIFKRKIGSEPGKLARFERKVKKLAMFFVSNVNERGQAQAPVLCCGPL